VFLIPASARAQDQGSSPAPAAAAAPAAPAPKPDATGANTGLGLSTSTPPVDNASPEGLNAWSADDVKNWSKNPKAPATNADLLKALDAAGQNAAALNIVWTLITGYLVMFMQAGFAMVETGFCRGRNAVHVMMLNMLVYGVGLLGWWIAGFGLMFGSVGPLTTFGSQPILSQPNLLHPQIGGHDFGIWGTHGFFMGSSVYDVGVYAMFLFQMVFMDTAATIPTGAMAERWAFPSFLVYGLVMSIVIYPFYGSMMWGGGGLSQLGTNFHLGHGAVDWAGSSVIHAVGGFVALAGAKIIGPRKGKFKPDGTPNAIPGHNIPMATIGAFILAFGWFGFNPGSSLAASGSNMRIAMIAVATMLASGAGAVVAILYMKMKTGKFDAGMAINGFLAGLVAITAPSGFVDATSAVIIGAIAAVITIEACFFVERKLKIDDPVGAFGVHGASGIWGLISVGIFADGSAGIGYNGTGTTTYLVHGVNTGANNVPLMGVTGCLHGDWGQLWANLIAAVICMVWAFGSAYVYFSLQKKIFPFRSPAADSPEEDLDTAEFGTIAYVHN
jgi:Amt family ammonium transporter